MCSLAEKEIKFTRANSYRFSTDVETSKGQQHYEMVYLT